MTVAGARPVRAMSGTINNKVSAVAGAKRFQIADLAREGKISYDTAKRLWTGEAKGISFDVLEAVCHALDCTPNDLFWVEEAPAEY